MFDDSPILWVKNLNMQFGKGCSHCQSTEAELEGNLCPHCGTVYAVQDASINLYPGEIIGIVGESGSGKSTFMQCLYFDKQPSSGEIYIQPYDGGQKNVATVSGQEKRHIRNNIYGMVYQNPHLGLRMNFSALSNIAEKQIAAGWRRVDDMVERGNELLERVRIPKMRSDEAPRNFSGGMQQRVQIAKALSNNPPILLLDEVTTGLDLSVQANVLDLIVELRRELNISMIVVSHDLGVIRMLADRTYVMLHGKIVEHGLTDQVLEDPQHSYTQQLISSLL